MMPPKNTPTPDPWAECTFEGAELAELRRSAALTFAEKVAWLEEAHRLSMIFQESHRKTGQKTVYQNGQIEN